MLILGLNMFHADASAAIVLDGEVKSAIAEERLNRHKHFGGFPALAVKACLDAVGAKISDVEHVAVGQDSDANLSKKVQYALANPAKILNFIRLRQRKAAMRDVRSLLSAALEVDPSQLRFQEHHLEHHIAHIASAYYCSPWEKAAGFSYDGSGDFVSTMMARCEGSEIARGAEPQALVRLRLALERAGNHELAPVILERGLLEVQEAHAGGLQQRFKLVLRVENPDGLFAQQRAQLPEQVGGIDQHVADAQDAVGAGNPLDDEAGFRVHRGEGEPGGLDDGLAGQYFEGLPRGDAEGRGRGGAGLAKARGQMPAETL